MSVYLILRMVPQLAQQWQADAGGGAIEVAAPIAYQRLGAGVALPALEPPPADRAGRADPEPQRRLRQEIPSAIAGVP